jgi:hypothetical protein
MQVKIADETEAKLIELAGGKNKVGMYLDQVVAMLYEMQSKEEDERDAVLAREIREAIERGERETVSLAEVEADLRAKGRLSV